jgi:hypothetical protein
MTAKELSPKQARWVEELARFDFEIEYKPGQDNPANGPARRPDYAKGILVGEQQAERDAMLPTLQQKLRIWAIRKRCGINSSPGQALLVPVEALKPLIHLARNSLTRCQFKTTRR